MKVTTLSRGDCILTCLTQLVNNETRLKRRKGTFQDLATAFEERLQSTAESCLYRANCLHHPQSICGVSCVCHPNIIRIEVEHIDGYTLQDPVKLDIEDSQSSILHRHMFQFARIINLYSFAYRHVRNVSSIACFQCHQETEDKMMISAHDDDSEPIDLIDHRGWCVPSKWANIEWGYYGRHIASEHRKAIQSIVDFNEHSRFWSDHEQLMPLHNSIVGSLATDPNISCIRWRYHPDSGRVSRIVENALSANNQKSIGSKVSPKSKVTVSRKRRRAAPTSLTLDTSPLSPEDEAYLAPFDELNRRKDEMDSDFEDGGVESILSDSSSESESDTNSSDENVTTNDTFTLHRQTQQKHGLDMSPAYNNKELTLSLSTTPSLPQRGRVVPHHTLLIQRTLPTNAPPPLPFIVPCEDSVILSEHTTHSTLPEHTDANVLIDFQDFVRRDWEFVYSSEFWRRQLLPLLSNLANRGDKNNFTRVWLFLRRREFHLDTILPCPGHKIWTTPERDHNQCWFCQKTAVNAWTHQFYCPDDGLWHPVDKECTQAINTIVDVMTEVRLVRVRVRASLRHRQLLLETADLATGLAYHSREEVLERDLCPELMAEVWSKHFQSMLDVIRDAQFVLSCFQTHLHSSSQQNCGTS